MIFFIPAGCYKCNLTGERENSAHNHRICLSNIVFLREGGALSFQLLNSNCI